DRMRGAHVKLKKRMKELKEEMAGQAESFGSGGREEMELVKASKANALTALKQREQELGAELITLNKDFSQIRLADGQDRLRKAINEEEQFVNDLTRQVRK